MASDAKGRISLQENSLSSQESSNRGHRDEHVQSNDDKNLGSTRMPEPLSGNPYFICILSKSNIQNQFQLVVPRHFYSSLPEGLVPIVLSCRNETWNMHYMGDRALRRFDAGWKKFALDNHLKVGDACIFELMDSTKIKFKVQILDGKIPFDSPAKGQSSDAPIIIN